MEKTGIFVSKKRKLIDEANWQNQNMSEKWIFGGANHNDTKDFSSLAQAHASSNQLDSPFQSFSFITIQPYREPGVKMITPAEKPKHTTPVNSQPKKKTKLEPWEKTFDTYNWYESSFNAVGYMPMRKPMLSNLKLNGKILQTSTVPKAEIPAPQSRPATIPSAWSGRLRAHVDRSLPIQKRTPTVRDVLHELKQCICYQKDDDKEAGAGTDQNIQDAIGRKETALEMWVEVGKTVEFMVGIVVKHLEEDNEPEVTTSL